jgi:TPR repeat protein
VVDDVAAGAVPSRAAASFAASVEEILAGSPDGLFNAAVDLDDAGVEQAREVLYRMAATRGVREAWLNLAYVVLDSGRTAEGFALLGESARAGDPKGVFMYAQELEARGVLDDAARWYARADGVPGAQM